MNFPIRYNKNNMTLTIQIGKYYKFLQCPFATWWKARKYFIRPKFKFYFGPMWKFLGRKTSKFGEYDDYKYLGGYWPAVSTEFLKWYTPKWFPIQVMSRDIGWKDKYDTPRYERPGYFIIFFGRNYYKHWQFSMVVHAPKFYCCHDCTVNDSDDNYWESILWYLHYADYYNSKTKRKNIIKARDSLKSEWFGSKLIDIVDYDILATGSERLFVNTEKSFYYIDVKSEQLTDVLEEINYYPKQKLISEFNLYVGNSSKQCEYCKFIADDTLKIYFNYDISKELDTTKLYVSKNIYYGPTFKDDFLTNSAREYIKEFHKKI